MDDLTIARRFAAAITALESDNDVEPVVALYAQQSSCGNSLRPDAFEGPDGAREFWLQYRGQFGSVQSTFRQIIDGEAAAALEWETTGEVAGESVQYRGVTMLDLDAEVITRSCAYFDPSSLRTRLEPPVDSAASVTDGGDG